MTAHSQHSPGAMSSHSRSQSHSQSCSQPLVQAFRASKSTKTTTPLVSPRGPFSVGQSHPPMLSPAARTSDGRSSSPNYFGLVVESADSHSLPRENWSPASSSIKSFGASLPKPVTLEGNREFEAFRKQADVNRGRSLAAPTAHCHPTNGMSATRPRPSRWHTHASDMSRDVSFLRSVKDRALGKIESHDKDSLHDSAYVSSDSKRNSESSLMPPQITNLPRQESPQPVEESELRNGRGQMWTNATYPPPLQLEPATSTSQHSSTVSRSATLPSKLKLDQPRMITGSQFRELTESIPHERLLILDIRSAPNYASSRIIGSLNLCIPTTLLKRPSYNIEKLQQTFQSGSENSKFASWKDMQWIVVYDSHASDRRDAVTAQNMVKKFTNEGYSGNHAILRGGFNMIQEHFPELVDTPSTAEMTDKANRNGAGFGIAPVVGGVSLPGSSNNFNPFFSNIRQNMDLADGVGQFEVARPEGLQSPSLPQWLRKAASEQDRGKEVSEKFLRIEQDEQARMKDAYAAFNPNNTECKNKVQLSGVEKGGKNRYKDILPFDHTRVRLQHRPDGVCDYVNASHLSASRSHKRYIASQGPLPATFEDFWSVVWEQDVRVVVMLTAESEGGQLKCHPYWKGRDFGPIRLAALSEKKVSLDIDKYQSGSISTPPSATPEQGRRRAHTTNTFNLTMPSNQAQPSQSNTAPYVTVRKFALSHTAHPFAPIREITHLHFPSWPDFGTPAQPSHLLALVELANVMQRSALPVETASVVDSRNGPRDTLPLSWYDEPEADSQARPMLVHCSAGCGRTGAFCTVDSVIDMLKRRRHAGLASQTGRDADGDTAMAGFNDSMSPTSKESKSQFFQSGSVTPQKRKSQEMSNIDVTWLEDENVDLIQKTVEDFREQRLSMVQSLRQYVLCYETIMEWAWRITERESNSSRPRSEIITETSQEG